MRFEEVYAGWNMGRLTQAEAAPVWGVCARSFRRYQVRYEADGLEGWVWKAYGRTTGRLVDWEGEDRSRETLKNMLDRLQGSNVRIFFADLVGYREAGS
jgi:hypothetical protein